MKPKKTPPVAKKAADTVDGFMRALKHPLKVEIEAVRRIILEVSPKIGEAVKWNAPSFRTTEFFATVNLRSVDRVQLILHLGAKVRTDLKEVTLSDPAGLLKWLAKDRCSLTLGADTEIAPQRAALEKIIRQWIAYV
ncbi:MAG: DUF1801 domain-containing protein [Verrucomicrobia bacterium]|nr:DUF1801 domain-containing protein [Verrucomicrobiota bacterium]